MVAGGGVGVMDGNRPSGLRFPFEAPPAPGDAVEVAPGILWLRLPLPMKLDHVNVYALDEGTSWTIVDAGMDTRESRAVWGDLLAGPLQGRPVSRVVATHHHPDHMGLAGWFQTEHGAALFTSRTAWLVARMLVLEVQERPTEAGLAFAESAGIGATAVADMADRRPFNFSDVVSPLPESYARLEDGDRITLGGRVWDVHFGQGHAPDHLTLWNRKDGIVLGADQFLATISPVVGLYAAEPDADPMGDFLHSLDRFRPMARDEHLVLPGHKLPFHGLPERLDGLLAEHAEALDRLETFLETPRVATETFPLLFKAKIDDANLFLAISEAMAHLIHLVHLGRAERVRREDGAWLWRKAGR